jgi:hypothetical protein
VLRRGIAPVTLVVAVVLEIWLLTGVALDQVVQFVGYELGFVALPGVAVLWALRGRPRGFLELVGLGMPIGFTLEILAFSATAAAGARALFLAYPVVVSALCGLAVVRRRRESAPVTTTPPISTRVMWMAALAISAGLVYVALIFIPQAPLPGAGRSVSYIPDFVYEMSKTAEALHHWPATNPGLSGVPLPYEWFVFFHMAAVSQVTHLSIPIVALRLDFVPFILVIGCQLLMLGRALSGTAATGVIAIVVLFLLGPLDLTTDSTGGSPFFSVFGVDLSISWTFTFGVMFFIALLYLIGERLSAPAWRTRRDIGRWSIFALLLVGSSGAKATILPVVLVGTVLYAAYAAITQRAKPAPQLLVALALEASVFLITFWVIYRGGAPFTQVGPLASLARTLPVADLNQSSLPGAVRWILTPFAYAAGLAGMLLPLAGLFYVLRRRHRRAASRYALCIGMLIGGLIIGNVFHQVSYSELYFQDTGYIAGCIVAADGLRLAWLDMGSALPASKRAATVALACWIAALLAVVIATLPAEHEAQTGMVRDAAFVVGGVVFVAGWLVTARMRRYPTVGILGLGLIPVLAASALASPIEMAPTAGLILTDASVVYAKTTPSAVRRLTPDLFAALQWLKAHTSVNAVIAVSNHWLDAANTNGRYYYYSAFSERQVFIEGYDPVRYAINTSWSTAEGADFAEREILNNYVFKYADAEALETMTQQYSVRYLLIDSQDGDSDDDSRAVAALGTVVFQDSTATIVAVG